MLFSSVIWYIECKNYLLILASTRNELDGILRIEDPERFVNAVRSLKSNDETTKSSRTRTHEPLLIAAKYGCHKILKSILDLNEKMRDEPYNINLNDSNDHGENILHLGITIICDSLNKNSKIFQNFPSSLI